MKKRGYRVLSLLVICLVACMLFAAPLAAADVYTLPLGLLQGDFMQETEGINAIDINGEKAISMFQLARYTGSYAAWDSQINGNIYENHSGTSLFHDQIPAIYKVDASASSKPSSLQSDTEPEGLIEKTPQNFDDIYYPTTKAVSNVTLWTDYSNVKYSYRKVEQSSKSVIAGGDRYLPISYLGVMGYQYYWEGSKLMIRIATDAYRLPASVGSPSQLASARAALNKDVQALNTPKLLGTYTTYYDTSLGNRSTNVWLATTAIHGTYVAPGEIFSFNKTVGPRTAARGYKTAIIFQGGKQTYGLGGGICQVSSTLYNTVMNSGLQTVERWSHSLPVTYVPKGKDATVSYGSADYRFKNNTNTRIQVHATAKSGVLTISIYTAPQY